MLYLLSPAYRHAKGKVKAGEMIGWFAGLSVVESKVDVFIFYANRIARIIRMTIAIIL